ncbi:hypothetical protein GCM10027414_11370 [Humibacter ginsengiterrae]
MKRIAITPTAAKRRNIPKPSTVISDGKSKEMTALGESEHHESARSERRVIAEEEAAERGEDRDQT